MSGRITSDLFRERDMFLFHYDYNYFQFHDLQLRLKIPFFLNVINYDYNYFSKVIEYNSNNFDFMGRKYQ